MKLIPSGVGTYSKMPKRYPAGVPLRAQWGYGAYVDAGGLKWLDYVAGLGSVILGHNNEAVAGAVQQQLWKGINLPLPTRLEEEVAQLIVDMVPSAQSVRFCKNGADATAAAVRIARAATGRERVLSCGYHGYQDWCIADSRGVPFEIGELTHNFKYNDLWHLVYQLETYEPACVIMEPVLSGNPQLPKDGYLQDVRRACDEAGALLIFDEVVTGFRMALGGAQRVFDVMPDLTCLGKAMGNGMPLAAVCGKWEYMKLLEEGVFFSTTFAGELLSLAAAKACLTVIRDQDVPAKLWEKGDGLQRQFREIAAHLDLSEEAQTVGYAERPVIRFRDPEASRIFGEKLVQHRILYQGYHNLMLAHSQEDLDKTVDAYEVGLKAVKEALVHD